MRQWRWFGSLVLILVVTPSFVPAQQQEERRRQIERQLEAEQERLRRGTGQQPERQLQNTIDTAQILAKFGIPLPSDTRVAVPDASASSAASAFSGMWFGIWDGNKLDHILVVEEINGDQARVIYATGDSSAWRYKRGFSRATGRLKDDGQTLSVELRRPATVTYRMRRDGKLAAYYRYSGGSATAVMTKMSSP